MTSFACVRLFGKFTFEVPGFCWPVGYTVTKPATLPLVAVTLRITAVASAGTAAGICETTPRRGAPRLLRVSVARSGLSRRV